VQNLVDEFGGHVTEFSCVGPGFVQGFGVLEFRVCLHSLELCVRGTRSKAVSWCSRQF
jgi:hypothetical protein